MYLQSRWSTYNRCFRKFTHAWGRAIAEVSTVITVWSSVSPLLNVVLTLRILCQRSGTVHPPQLLRNSHRDPALQFHCLNTTEDRFGRKLRGSLHLISRTSSNDSFRPGRRLIMRSSAALTTNAPPRRESVVWSPRCLRSAGGRRRYGARPRPAFASQRRAFVDRLERSRW